MGTRFAAWLGAWLGDDGLRVDGSGRLELGHSAEMVSCTLVTGCAARRRDVVVRLQPPSPGLLEPYDLRRQFDVMRALETTEVRAPTVLAIEPTGSVLGRPFLVMDRVEGDVFERDVPETIGPPQVRRMCEDMVDQLAAIHLVDLDATGLSALGDGSTYIDRELDRWESEMRRVRRGPLPALERLFVELRRSRPAPSPHVTLVHGVAKPGNVAFVGDRVAAVFDWELADVGDPRADLGYAEVLWAVPVGLPARPGAPTADALVARWEARTGLPVTDRPWFRAFQAAKLATIMLLGSMLFDAGHRDDPRLAEMAFGVPMITDVGLADLGVSASLDHGPVLPRGERLATLARRD